MKDSPNENAGDITGKSPTIIDTDLSVFRLSKLEILLATVTGIAGWVGFRSILQITLPYPCGIGSNGEVVDWCGWTFEESWTQLGSSLFSTFSLPITMILAVSAVFLLRAVRGDERYFSTLGNLALAWPLISFPLINLLSFLSLYCVPVGMGIAFIAGLKSLKTKRHVGDWLAFILSVAWFWLLMIYFDQWWSRYGD